MENTNNITNPENKKSTNDFMKLFIGIFIVIVSLVAIKYFAQMLGII